MDSRAFEDERSHSHVCGKGSICHWVLVGLVNDGNFQAMVFVRRQRERLVVWDVVARKPALVVLGRRWEFLTFDCHVRRIVVGKWLDKARSEAKPGPGGPARDDGDWALKYPAAWEYLCEVDAGGGRKRQKATLTLFTEDGMWKLAFRDRDERRTCFVSGATPSEALQRLEEGLEEDLLDWRADRPSGPHGKGR